MAVFVFGTDVGAGVGPVTPGPVDKIPGCPPNWPPNWPEGRDVRMLPVVSRVAPTVSPVTVAVPTDGLPPAREEAGSDSDPGGEPG